MYVIELLKNMGWEFLVLSVSFVGMLSYALYKIFDESKNIKKDQIMEGTKNLERKFEEMVVVDDTKLLKKYRNIIRESILNRFYINIYFFTLLALMIAIVAFERGMKYFNQVPAGIIIGIGFFTIPFIFLEFEVSYRRSNVRRHLPHFLLMFQQTHEATGDTITTFKTIKDNIKDPIKGYVKELLKNISKGMDNKEAIEILKSRSDNSVFHSFCDNILNDMEYGRIIKHEIEQDIIAAFMHEENYSNRITENSGNLISIAAVSILFVIGTKNITNMSGEFLYIIRNNDNAKIAIDIVIGIVIGVFWLAKTSISYKDN